MSVIDLIVPVKNEEKNIHDLVVEVDKAFTKSRIEYRIIFVIDKSTDNTLEEAFQSANSYPVIIHEKAGKGGKGYSILEGIDISTSPLVGYIDGDLQYPPKHLPKMVRKLLDNPEIGVVVANRKSYHMNIVRKAISRVNAFFIGRILLGMKCDIQSGMKVFRKDIADFINKDLITPWTFDIPMLHAAKEIGYKIEGIEIDFLERTYDRSKVGIVKTSWAVAMCALKTKFSKHKVYYREEHPVKGQQIMYHGKTYVPHTNLSHNKSAIFTLMPGQKIFIGISLIAFLIFLILNPLNTAIIVVAILSTIYFIDVFFNLYLILKSLHFPPEINFTSKELSQIEDSKLPVYTVLCPLYKESEVLPYFVKNIENFDWPKDKLEVLLLLEENDKETQEAAINMDLPNYFRIVVVPHSMPKTKPKACNYGLRRALGDYVVIYDAEDKPESDQLKKAYLAFQNSKEKVVCVQAKLNYYNTHHNLLTRMFTAEYSLWFDVILPGLQSINTTIPLGGTSNHFKTKFLQSIHGWDPFNVTEDCDLGVRLFKEGYKTAIIDSTTLEEANSDVKNWIRQRSRWLKGYMQTYFVHMRNPVDFVRKNGVHALIFQLIIGLRIYFILINPILWLTTLSYFVLYAYVGPAIESLYPAPVFYMAVTSLIFGNFTYLYNYMIGCAKRKQWTVIKFVFLVPFYWVLMCVAAGMAFYQLIFKPHHWEKTNHGLHLIKKDSKIWNKIPAIALPAIPKIKFNAPAITPNINFGFGFIPQKLISLSLRGEIILVVSVMIGNVLNFAYNAYLSRTLDLEYFGLISLFGNFIFIASIFFSALTNTVTYESGFSFGKHGKVIDAFWRKTRSKIFLTSIGFWAVWMIIVPVLQNFFHSPSLIPFLIFAPVWVIGALAAVDYGFLNGHHKFKILSIIVVTEALSKLIFTFLFVSLGYESLVLVAIPLSMFTTLAIGYTFATKVIDSDVKVNKVKEFPSGFFITSVFTRFSIIAFISFDLILAKHNLSPTDAGYYALIALVGKMVFLLSSLSSQFLTPHISHHVGAQKDTNKKFLIILSISSAIGFIAYIGLGLLGPITAPLLLGANIIPVVSLLPFYALSILFVSIASTVIGYHQVKKNVKFPLFSVFFAAIEIITLFFFAHTLYQFVYQLLFLSLIYLAIILLLHRFNDKLDAIYLNLLDFVDLFNDLPVEHVSNKVKKILILNWRDTKHTWAGGAEVYVHEIAKCLVKDGMSVVVFCGNDQHCKRYEVIDGVHIIRRGGMFTVYIWAFLYYVCKFRGNFDVILDSENGIPFFSPIYARIPVIGLVHHVHREIIIKELELAFYLKPFAYVARLLETRVMPFVYRNSQMITVSNSTLDDMRRIGLGKNKQIEIVNPGIELGKFQVGEKTPYPSVLYLGRLKPYKSIEVAIHAVADLVKDFPDIIFNIAGFGDHRPVLEKMVKKLNIQNNVKFLGKVSEESKVKLMAESWVFVYPSVWEGWGISVIEANACGTPVVASRVPGLKDSVDNPHSGYLVEYGNSKEFAKKMKTIIKNPELREKLAITSQVWANKFTWEKSTEKLEDLFSKLKNETR